MAFNKAKAHERAERFAAKGQHDKAAREYQTIVENDPTDIRAWLMLADCLVRCGDKPGAVARYERVASYYVDAKEHNKALAVFRQVLNLDPQRLDVQARVASLHHQLGNQQDAIALYERVAHAQMQLGRIADALTTYKVVADIDPAAVARRLRLAELYSREKKTPEAVEAFRLAGEELRKLGRMADFVRVAERLLFHDDKDLVTIRRLAAAYLSLGDPRRALMKLNGLLRSNAKDEEGIELLAETFMALGKPEKALSALEELARALRAKGPEAKEHTIRILRRGLEWRPGHAEFREALGELEGRRRGTSNVQEVQRVESEELETLDEDDLVELDEDDLVIEEPDDPRAADQVSAVTPQERATVDLPEAASPAPGTRRTMEVEAVPPVEPSLTQSVLNEAESAPHDVEGLTDFDKILFEARVYIKYRLFEHALDHVESALGQQPQHIGALSLRARALSEMGRGDEAAGSHVEIATLVMASDPKLAREHLQAARGLVPDHPGAQALTAQLEGAAETPARSRDEGDSGAIDLVDFDEAQPAPEIEIQLDDEPAANLVDAHEPHPTEGVDGESTQPFTPIDPDSLNDEPPEPQAPAQTGMTLTPFGQPGELTATPDELVPAPAPAEDELELPDELEPVGVDHAAQRFAAEGVDPLEGLDEEMAAEEAAAAASAAPAPAATPPPGGWVDLSDDLAEIRFYIDQGLDDDAEAALDDLESRYPGHPEIRAFRGGGTATEEPAAVLVEAEAAQPLIDVDEEPEPFSFEDDEDEDDYLSAIFADPTDTGQKRSGGSPSSAGANVAEGQAVDAATAFDLGVAYREMGLVDAAIGQFETASHDPQWRARALTMLGTLRVHQGDTQAAIADLQEAAGLANTANEASEAAYELGVLYEKLGDTGSAIEQLQRVAPGYRDRDQRLAQLGG